jgi:Mg2+ transporter (mgtE)
MPHPSEQFESQPHAQLGKFQVLLESGTFREVRRLLNGLRPVEIARLIESSPPPSRSLLWELIDKDVSGEVLEELSYDIQSHFLKRLNTKELVRLTEGLESDDVVDILQQLPEAIIQEVLLAMTDQDRSRVETILSYSEDTAGGLTNTDTITVRPRFSLDVVLRYLRRHSDLPPSTDSLIVVNRKDEYLGLLPLSRLLTSAPNVTVREVMVTDTDPIRCDMSDIEVAKLFEQHDWISAPVVDEQGKLLGRITIDDVVDVIRDQADHSLMSMAGLDEDEDTFATAVKTTPRRAIWLGVNLITAILASSVINIFEGTIEKVVALAVLMPIVASMGGVAGSQTLTVVIRGMALGHIGPSNLSWLLSRELRVGIFNGLLWALIVGLVVAWWFNDLQLAMILGAAMVINLITASLAGALVPIFLRAMKVDPALAGGVTLTTVTDVVGFFAFLGLATYFYA